MPEAAGQVLDERIPSCESSREWSIPAWLDPHPSMGMFSHAVSMSAVRLGRVLGHYGHDALGILLSYRSARAVRDRFVVLRSPVEYRAAAEGLDPKQVDRRL